MKVTLFFLLLKSKDSDTPTSLYSLSSINLLIFLIIQNLRPSFLIFVFLLHDFTYIPPTLLFQIFYLNACRHSKTSPHPLIYLLACCCPLFILIFFFNLSCLLVVYAGVHFLPFPFLFPFWPLCITIRTPTFWVKKKKNIYIYI